MIKVIVDAYGGDNAPFEIVKGSVQAINENKDLHIILCGKEEELKKVLSNYSFNSEQLSIENATDVIENTDQPTIAIRQKTDSSLVKSFNKMKEDEEIAGLVSAGSTGAVLTGAFMKIGRISGVSRPALCPILPTLTGKNVAIADCGANMDCKPQNLLHFAIMANAYMKTVYNIENPRVALLNVGTEEQKGNELTKEVFNMLSDNKNLNFVGNMESRDLLSGNYDIVIADGFAGNVLLKSSEGAIMYLMNTLKTSIKSRFMSKIGALFMRKTFKELKVKMDYNKFGGAVLLGCKKLIVKSHGTSNADSIKASINLLLSMHKGNMIEKIQTEISSTEMVANNE